MRYVSKPQYVDAVQLAPETLDEFIELFGKEQTDDHRYTAQWSEDQKLFGVVLVHDGWICSFHVGDWLIKFPDDGDLFSNSFTVSGDRVFRAKYQHLDVMRED